LVAVAYFGTIYTSTNSGATWTQTGASSNSWSSVSSSADGTKLVALTVGSLSDVIHDNFSGQIWVSTDSGATWRATSPGGYWSCVASSADAGRSVAASYYGSIYTSQPTGSPLLSLRLSGGNLLVSWLVPSAGFVLQQSFDLGSTNWTDVPTPPTLNFTNLHHQVSVSPSLGSGFYRLKQQ